MESLVLGFRIPWELLCSGTVSTGRTHVSQGHSWHPVHIMAQMPAYHTVSSMLTGYADATVSKNWSVSSGHGSEAHSKDGGQQRRLGKLRHPGMCLLGLAHISQNHLGGRAGTTASEAQQLFTSQHLLVSVMTKKGRGVCEMGRGLLVSPRRH